MVSKDLAKPLNIALPPLISSNQISLKLKGLLLTVDIEKVFDSVNHNFLSKALENYGFSQDLLKYLHFNCGKTMCCFPLKGVPNKAALFQPTFFFLFLEILFIFIKENKISKI